MLHPGEIMFAVRSAAIIAVKCNGLLFDFELVDGFNERLRIVFDFR